MYSQRMLPRASFSRFAGQPNFTLPASNASGRGRHRMMMLREAWCFS
jgi:hypothetical protein